MAEDKLAKLKETPPTASQSLTLQNMVLILTWFGVFDVAASLFHLWNGFANGFTGTVWADFSFNAAIGGLIFTAARILARGKILGLWIFIACMLLSLAYSFVMGRGINVVTALFGSYITWMLFNIQKKGELS
jgi:hypothetical protein